VPRDRNRRLVWQEGGGCLLGVVARDLLLLPLSRRFPARGTLFKLSFFPLLLCRPSLNVIPRATRTRWLDNPHALLLFSSIAFLSSLCCFYARHHFLYGPRGRPSRVKLARALRRSLAVILPRYARARKRGIDQKR